VISHFTLISVIFFSPSSTYIYLFLQHKLNSNLRTYFEWDTLDNVLKYTTLVVLKQTQTIFKITVNRKQNKADIFTLATYLCYAKKLQI